MPGHQSPTFVGQYFFFSLTTCWSKQIPALMDDQKRDCLNCYWYLPTYSSLTSLFKRNLFSIFPDLPSPSSAEVLLVCYSALILYMGYQVYNETVISWKTDYILSWNVLILAFIFRNNATVKFTTLQETLKACSWSLYPNVHTILRLLLITPVTSATLERSNSSLRFVKNVYHSTMGE